MTPEEYCQQKAASSGSSFYYSFMFLPPIALTVAFAIGAASLDDLVESLYL